MTVVIQAPRLRLRTLDPEHDADAMLELVNDPGFIAGINDRGIRTCEQARASARLGAGPPCATWFCALGGADARGRRVDRHVGLAIS